MMTSNPQQTTPSCVRQHHRLVLFLSSWVGLFGYSCHAEAASPHTIRALLPASPSTEKSSAYGRYQQLRQVMHCPQDQHQYGQYHDYGYWAGGSWCGQQGQAGYWVWSAPDWYIWQHKAQP